MGTRVLAPRVKAIGAQTDHSSPTSAGVNNEWSYNSTLACSFTACTGKILHWLYLIFPFEQSNPVILGSRGFVSLQRCCGWGLISSEIWYRVDRYLPMFLRGFLTPSSEFKQSKNSGLSRPWRWIFRNVGNSRRGIISQRAWIFTLASLWSYFRDQNK